ncbi:hypothetical protein HPB47_026800 [Ixodes persulcatus]|uniref:Uncharacterized protein n=1 Tax=Ixodes persulcatus TaxID=34615 RepID=A0AC60PYB1_IXOPE|nr:hypothetical protein HPB47_026800 [Ixodes persulcatus]
MQLASWCQGIPTVVVILKNHESPIRGAGEPESYQTTVGSTPGLCLALVGGWLTYWADPLPRWCPPLHVKRAASSAKSSPEMKSEGLAPLPGRTAQEEGAMKSLPSPQWHLGPLYHRVCQLLLQLRVNAQAEKSSAWAWGSAAVSHV